MNSNQKFTAIAVVILIGIIALPDSSDSQAKKAFSTCQKEQEYRKANFGGRHTYGGGPGQINGFVCAEVKKICETESAVKCDQVLESSLD